MAQLVRAIVLLQNTKAAREAKAAKEDAEAAQSVQPGFSSAIRCRAELGEVVVGRNGSFGGLFSV